MCTSLPKKYTPAALFLLIFAAKWFASEDGN